MRTSNFQFTHRHRAHTSLPPFRKIKNRQFSIVNRQSPRTSTPLRSLRSLLFNLPFPPSSSPASTSPATTTKPSSPFSNATAPPTSSAPSSASATCASPTNNNTSKPSSLSPTSNTPK